MDNQIFTEKAQFMCTIHELDTQRGTPWSPPFFFERTPFLEDERTGAAATASRGQRGLSLVKRGSEFGLGIFRGTDGRGRDESPEEGTVAAQWAGRIALFRWLSSGVIRIGPPV